MELNQTSDVCGPLFEEELEFWGLDSNQVCNPTRKLCNPTHLNFHSNVAGRALLLDDVHDPQGHPGHPGHPRQAGHRDGQADGRGDCKEVWL